MAGDWLRSGRDGNGKTMGLLVAGLVLVVLGLAWGASFPINKSLWTVSFSVFMAGISTILFAACYWVCDARGIRWWTKPLEIYGLNAIAAYILAGFLARITSMIKLDGGVSLKRFLFQNVFAPLASPQNASLLYAIAFDLVIFGFVWFMYRRRWFLRF